MPDPSEHPHDGYALKYRDADGIRWTLDNRGIVKRVRWWRTPV